MTERLTLWLKYSQRHLLLYTPCGTHTFYKYLPQHMTVFKICNLNACTSLCYNSHERWLQSILRITFISEKYKTIQIFKLISFQKISLLQLYNSISVCKIFGNFPGIQIVEAFSDLSSQS